MTKRGLATIGVSIALFSTAALIAFAVTTGGEPMDSPHAFIDDVEQCQLCHVVQWEGEVGQLEPGEFATLLTDVCVQCHEENLTRSHPVGSSPYKIIDRDDYPEELMLQWSDDKLEDVMTCATCHAVHVERFSEEKIYSRQKPYPGTDELYLNYGLRFYGADPRDGFAPLCKACHPRL